MCMTTVSHNTSRNCTFKLRVEKSLIMKKTIAPPPPPKCPAPSQLALSGHINIQLVMLA